MITLHTPFWIWLLPLVISSPWVIGSIVLWRLSPRDGYVQPSAGELARARLRMN